MEWSKKQLKKAMYQLNDIINEERSLRVEQDELLKDLQRRNTWLWVCVIILMLTLFGIFWHYVYSNLFLW